MMTRVLKRSRMGLLVLLSLFLLAGLSACGAAKTVKLADYMRCSVGEYDGFGSLKENLDIDGLAGAVAEAAGYSEKKSDYEDKLDQIRDDLKDVLKGSWSKTDHIAVGDKLSYHWDVETEVLKKKYNVIFDTTEYTHTADADELESLKELKAEDLLKVTLSGYSGAGSVRIQNGSSEFKELVLQGADTLGELFSNGDVIKMTLSLKSGADLKEYFGLKGYKAPADGVISYTVTGLEEAQEIDLFESVLLNYQGVNGYAALSYEFADAAPDAVKALTLELSKKIDLSNGEEVKVSLPDGLGGSAWLSCLAKGYRLTAAEKTFTVEGLEEPRELDPFTYLTISYEGASGNGEAVLTVAAENEFNDVLSGIRILPDKETELSQGDEITCTVSVKDSDDVVDYCLRQYGVRLTATEKKYKVEEIDRYLTSYDEIPEELVKAMLSKVDEIDWQNGWDEVTIEKTEYLGRRFYVRPGYWADHSNNEVYFLYRFSAKHAELGEFVFYNYVCFSDILLKKDGTYVLDLDGYMISNQWCDPTGHMGWAGNVEGYETMEELLEVSEPNWVEEYELDEKLTTE